MWQPRLVPCCATRGFLGPERPLILWLPCSVAGEYADRIDNADDLLEHFIDAFPEEPIVVRLDRALDFGVALCFVGEGFRMCSTRPHVWRMCLGCLASGGIGHCVCST